MGRYNLPRGLAGIEPAVTSRRAASFSRDPTGSAPPAKQLNVPRSLAQPLLRAVGASPQTGARRRFVRQHRSPSAVLSALGPALAGRGLDGAIF